MTRRTLRSSLRSDTSNKVRLAMSLTSCWILGEYCLGAPSSGGVAMTSEWLAGLVFSCRRAQRAGVCRWSCCLEHEEEDQPSKTSSPQMRSQTMETLTLQGGDNREHSPDWRWTDVIPKNQLSTNAFLLPLGFLPFSRFLN